MKKKTAAALNVAFIKKIERNGRKSAAVADLRNDGGALDKTRGLGGFVDDADG